MPIPAQMRHSGRLATRAAKAIAREMRSEMRGSPSVPAVAA